LPKELKESLEFISKRDDTTIAQIVRRCLKKYAEENKKINQ